MNEEKEKIRQEAIKCRDKFEKHPDYSELIADRFLETFPNLDNKSIALYWPIKSEMDTSPLIERLLEKNVSVSLPKTLKAGEPLVFIEWDGKKKLVNSGFGTICPEDTSDNNVVPDIIVVPLVAFDRYGTRLGYGQGYYDLTISLLKEQGCDIQTVGYAYDQQICLFPLPKEEHDQKLDMILTPTQSY